ncbi:MAG: tRNA lysidine(34) synthetase TilS [Eubacteriales bacterium]|nr:tRNA lysidine(34) synthetase TilS [Eubacteriales bacterium]
MNLMPFMEQWHMLPHNGGTILCAVSGGRDSICLLHYLYEASRQYDFSVAAAHLNHLMRDTALRDVHFVQDFCRQRGIPFFVEEAPVYEMAEQWNISVEEAGRRLRYDFLYRTADAIGAERIATAHHKDDLAETVLLNLLRGTGPEGLGGIPPVRGRLIRPLLQTSRCEIDQYLEENGIGHVEDETNESMAFARNRLRKVIWPELESINPAVSENIARAAQIVRQENAFLNELAMTYLPADGTEIACDVLLQAPEVLRRRILRLLIDRLSVGKKDFGAVHLEALLRLAQSGGSLDLPSGVTAQCRNGTLQFFVAQDSLPEMELAEGCCHWGDYTICTRKTDRNFLQKKGAILLNCGKIDKSFSVRTWHRDDRLCLPGGRGERSVKRLFAEHGILPAMRQRWPVICVDGRAAAVYGIGTDERFLPTNGGKEIEITIYTNTQEDNGNG